MLVMCTWQTRVIVGIVVLKVTCLAIARTWVGRSWDTLSRSILDGDALREAREAALLPLRDLREQRVPRV